jgi:hypothetical protein
MSYNEAFSALLNEYRLDDIEQVARKDLFSIMDELGALNRWRDNQRDSTRLNHPTTVWRQFNKSDEHKAEQMARGEYTPPPTHPVREKPTLLEENVALREQVRDLSGQLQERTEERDNAREDRPGSLSPDALRAAYADHLCRLAREPGGTSEVNTDLLHEEHKKLQRDIAWRWTVDWNGEPHAAFDMGGGGIDLPGMALAEALEDEAAEPASETESETESEPEAADASIQAGHVAPSAEGVADDDDNPHRWQWVHGNLYEVRQEGRSYCIRFKVPNGRRWRDVGYAYPTAEKAMLVAEEAEEDSR